MRIDTLPFATVYDTSVGDPFANIYSIFPWLQYLVRCTTDYAISGTALKSGEAERMGMLMKSDAYSRHIQFIEDTLLNQLGGAIEEKREFELEDGTIDTYTHVERRTHGYLEMLQEGLPLNTKICLLGLKGQALKWIQLGCAAHEDMERFRWVSEVALGIDELHGGEIQDNPFKLHWRNL